MSIANLFKGNRSHPNIRDVELTFNAMNIDIVSLIDYLNNFDSLPCIINVPRYPLMIQRKEFCPIPKFVLKRSYGDTVPIRMKQVEYDDTSSDTNFQCIIDKTMGTNKISIKRIHFVDQMNKYNLRSRK